MLYTVKTHILLSSDILSMCMRDSGEEPCFTKQKFDTHYKHF